MHLATDCFAFDEQIHAGIYNVTAGIIYGLGLIAPDLNHTLVMRHESVSKALSQQMGIENPLVVFDASDAETALYAVIEGVGRTTESNLQIRLNGRLLPPTSFGSGWSEWEIDEPALRLELLSRTWVPAELLSGSDDRRQLGIAVTGMRLGGPFRRTSVDLHTDLVEGWHPAEAGMRWSSGVSQVPAGLMAGHGLPVRIRIEYLDTPYLRNREVGLPARHVFEFRTNASKLLRAVSESGLINRLSNATAFHSHHFGPRILPGKLNIATSYDMLPILKPHRFGGDAVQHFKRFSDVMKQCDRVLAISEHTRQDTMECLGLPEDRVVTARISCDGAFAPLPENQVNSTLDEFKLTRPYIVCVGTIEPRKNQLRVLQAWEALRSSRASLDLGLVFVGKHGWGVDDFLNAIAASAYVEDVHILHNVSTSELVRIYNGALLSIYISEYEGFGMPVLESMACGIPVITTNGSSMKEIADGAALLVDPYSIEDIAVSIGSIAQDEALRTRLSTAGFARRKEFSWSKCAESYLSVLREGGA